MKEKNWVFDQITIIGLGLIGSSIARAARKHDLAEFIVGCDSNDTALTYARSHGYIDTAVRDPAMAVGGSQIVILATPPSTLGAIGKKIAPKLQPHTIIMDTASIKQAAIDALAPVLPLEVDYVPAHPVAGSERSGGSAGTDDLFQRRRIIVTPAEPLSPQVMQAITTFWVTMGARVEGMPAPLHDLIYAYISHLPHLLAFAARTVVTPVHSDSGNVALQKFLRLSSSRTQLWGEIFYYNRENIKAALKSYLAAVRHIHEELSTNQPPQETTFDDTLARTVLFPRIAAACLITAVIEAEKEAGISFARFAGRGFADFTYAANTPPDHDIENISQKNMIVAGVLKEYIERLEMMHSLLETNKFTELQESLAAERKSA
jgi:cyclohexadieny/prephenate dehydrogenase